MTNAFPLPKKISLLQAPTPVQRLARISEELGVELFVKREDLTGLEWSGNKIRKLEFLIQEALNKGASCLVTCGGIQSNHCRATAALAARLGLRCILLLRGQEPAEWSGNFLLDKLFGAEIHYLSEEQYYQGMAEIQKNIAAQLRQSGGQAYFIPEGGSNPLGSLGYVSVWDELAEQLGKGGVPEAFDSVVVAHGSGGTLAGLALAKILRAEQVPALKDAKVVGVNVCYDKNRSEQLVKDILWAAIQQFQMQISFFADDFTVLDGFLGIGYAKNTPEELRFIAQVARDEGLLLDPTYTGKAFRGLYQTVKAARESLGKRILFIHTGGAFGVFKREAEWQAALQSN